MVDLNKLAKEITLKEGKKLSISIAQVKEVLRITLTRLSKMTTDEVIKILRKYSK